MPLGVAAVARAAMHRARRGLYAGRVIRFGNKVSEDGGNKSRRTWKPNVHWKRVYSHALDRMIRFRMTTHAMRCIDKAGGIDEYLLATPNAKLNSDVGAFWRSKIQAVLNSAARGAEHSPAALERQPRGLTEVLEGPSDSSSKDNGAGPAGLS
eukprot:SM000065S20223  [mRNA]  locus=s65:438632:439489:+ [translate_table: standard]